MNLYPGERKTLRFLAAFQAKHGWMPSRQEICEGMGWTSPNAAQDVLKRLQKQGAIVLAGARCIRIVCNPDEYQEEDAPTKSELYNRRNKVSDDSRYKQGVPWDLQTR